MGSLLHFISTSVYAWNFPQKKKREKRNKKMKIKNKMMFYIKMRSFKETIWQSTITKPNHHNKIHKQRKESPGKFLWHPPILVVASLELGEKGCLGMMAKGSEVSLGGNEMSKNWLWWKVYNYVNVLKATELYTSNEWIVWYANSIRIKTVQKECTIFVS